MPLAGRKSMPMTLSPLSSPVIAVVLLIVVGAFGSNATSVLSAVRPIAPGAAGCCSARPLIASPPTTAPTLVAEPAASG